MPYYLLPIWAGVFAESYLFGGTEIGLLLAADMVGGTVAAAAARFWITRARWRSALLWSLLIAVMANLLCTVVDGFNGLLVLRSIAGLAAGSYMAIVYADFAHAKNADREFSIALALQVMLGAATIAIAPAVLENWGRAGTFVLVGLGSALPFLVIRAWPERAVPTTAESAPAIHKVTWRVWLGLATICLFLLSLTAVWVAVERLAIANGMDAPLVTLVLSTGLLFSFLGAAAPAVTSKLAPRRLQVNISYLVLIGAIFVLGNYPIVWLFAGGLALYNFFFSFVVPFQTAWVAESDDTGANAVLVPLAQGVGVSIGPALGGWLLGSGNTAGVMYVSIAILAAGYACAYVAGDPIRVSAPAGDTLDT